MTERSLFDEQLYGTLLARQRMPRAELLAQQLGDLQEMVRHASRSVPFYRERCGGEVTIGGLGDLRRLPLVSREDVAADPTRFVAADEDLATLRHVGTGGTTGVSLMVYRDKDASFREPAHTFAAWHPFGIRSTDRTVGVVARPVGADGKHTVGDRGRRLWLGGDGRDPASLDTHVRRVHDFAPKMLPTIDVVGPGISSESREL